MNYVAVIRVFCNVYALLLKVALYILWYFNSADDFEFY